MFFLVKYFMRKYRRGEERRGGEWSKKISPRSGGRSGVLFCVRLSGERLRENQSWDGEADLYKARRWG